MAAAADRHDRAVGEDRRGPRAPVGTKPAAPLPVGGLLVGGAVARWRAVRGRPARAGRCRAWPTSVRRPGAALACWIPRLAVVGRVHGSRVEGRTSRARRGSSGAPLPTVGGLGRWRGSPDHRDRGPSRSGPRLPAHVEDHVGARRVRAVHPRDARQVRGVLLATAPRAAELVELGTRLDPPHGEPGHREHDQDDAAGDGDPGHHGRLPSRAASTRRRSAAPASLIAARTSLRSVTRSSRGRRAEGGEGSGGSGTFCLDTSIVRAPPLSLRAGGQVTGSSRSGV